MAVPVLRSIVGKFLPHALRATVETLGDIHSRQPDMKQRLKRRALNVAKDTAVSVLTGKGKKSIKRARGRDILKKRSPTKRAQLSVAKDRRQKDTYPLLLL